MPASAIDRLQTPLRNLYLQRISHRSAKLRGMFVTSSAVPYAPLAPNLLQGRSDAMKGLLNRLGIIPIASLPSGSSLQANLAAFPADRGGPETVTLTGGTAPQVYTAPNPPAVAVPFTAGGAGQVVTATDSLDAAAKGRATVDVLP
jgi:hypothetical protein